MLTKAMTYNDKKLDEISRSTFYMTIKAALAKFKESSVDEELLHAYAATLEAAACGFDDPNDDDPDVPAGMRQTTPYNDDLLNEMARDLYVQALTRVQDFIQGKTPLNIDKMNAYARIADAAACAFHEDEDEE